MSLQATLTRFTTFKPGDMKFAIVALSSLASVELEAQPGWLVANGASLLRTGKYANLFTALGTGHGAADGTHFSVPDHRDGFAPLAKGASVFTALGARGGEYLHAITPSEIPSHAHNYGDRLAPLYVGTGNTWWNGYSAATNPSTTFGRNSEAAVGGQGNGANGSTHENMPPIQVISAVLIKY